MAPADNRPGEKAKNSIEIDFQPLGRRVRIKPGTTVLEAAREAGVGLSAVCGGGGTCGRCRVRLAPNAPVEGPGPVEKSRLDSVDLAAGIRLACQIKPGGSLRVDLPPESLTTPQRTQVEGAARPPSVAPPVSVCDLALAPASKTDLRADWDRVADALAATEGVRPRGCNLAVLKQIPGLLRKNNWRIRVGLRGEEVVWVADPDTVCLGLAVDLGTTKIAGYLVALATGDTLAAKGMANPQIGFGEDVMARIVHSTDDAQGSARLQTVVVEAINGLAADLCAEAGMDCSQIVEAVVVGNPAMHHLMLGLPVAQLGRAPYVGAIASPLDLAGTDTGLALAPGARAYFPPHIAGFVGSDHVTMLLASGIGAGEKVVLGCDIGTNTEMTLQAGSRLVACSAASGPAFEGAHIHDGMRAAEGAIERVRIADGRIFCQTVGDVPAVGICGSGIIDAVAQLKCDGHLNRSGAFNPQSPLVRRGDAGPEVVLVPAASTGHGRDIVITRKDINEVQLAKGAIRAGIELLLAAVNLKAAEVDTVIIAGAFGTYIEVESALAIGMFPAVSPQRFRQEGNAAGMGAKQVLVSVDRRFRAAELAGRIDYLELATVSGFQDAFADALWL